MSASLTSCDAESFHRFCLFLESLHLKKKAEKLQAVEHFLKRFDGTCDLFPLLRLLLPGVDHERGAYGLKESNLAKLFGEMLSLPEAQRQRLLKWKDPALQEGYRCAAGDFASVLFSVVEGRAPKAASTLTLGDVNLALTKIHNAPDATEKRNQLLEVARRASATEQKWIAKMILKDLKVGISHESLLKRFHPDAMELYNRSSNLKQVLDEIRSQYVRAKVEHTEEGARGGAEPVQPSQPRAGHDSILFSKFKPMLAQRLRLDSLSQIFEGSKTFSVEPKYDGERILAHVDVEAKRVELYTRSAIDYTSAYAPSMRPVFLQGLLGRQAVLDGEMLAWDEDEQAFIAFGSNRTVAQMNNQRKHLCFVVFDVLFYMDAEGQSYDLRQTPLKARQDFLAKIVVPKEHWLELVPGLPMSNAEEAQRRLEGAIEARLEGLVLKDMSSKYFFNARKRGWYKIKPEYDGLSETLDLIVVGAYFGDTARRRALQGQSTDLADHCSQFLLAALRHSSTPEASVITVCRVGTGFSMDQLKEMRAKLRPHLKRYDPHRVPSWMGGWRGGPKSKPDAVLDSPSHGFVMEVRAAEIVPSEEYEFGHTLRFPRAVKAFRDDKEWSDANTDKDLREFLVEGARNALTGRRVKAKVEVQSEGEDTDEGAGSPKKPAARPRVLRKRSFGVLEGFRPADTAQVPVASELLKGAEVFVVNGDAQYSKADLEAYVVRHGGRHVQNFLRGRTSLVVAASLSDLRIQNLAKTAQVDIVLYTYLFECETAGKMLPLKPRHMLATSPETKAQLSYAFDQWGDAFYEEVSASALKAVLERISDVNAAQVPEDLVKTLEEHPKLQGSRPPWEAAERKAAATA